MSTSSPLGFIEALEERLFCVSEALKNGNVEDLVTSAAEFQALVVDIAKSKAQWQDPQHAPATEAVIRMERVGATLVQLREQLVRRQGLVEQALKVVIPATHTPVYTQQLTPYGAGARSSGRFQAFTA
jgi:hypothetical protein